MSGYTEKSMSGLVQFQVLGVSFAMLVCHSVDCWACSTSLGSGPINFVEAFKPV